MYLNQKFRIRSLYQSHKLHHIKLSSQFLYDMNVYKTFAIIYFTSIASVT